MQPQPKRTEEQIEAEIEKLETEADQAERIDTAAQEAVIAADNAEAMAILECGKARAQVLVAARGKYLSGKAFNQIMGRLRKLDRELAKLQ